MIKLIAFDLCGVVFKERHIIKNLFIELFPGVEYTLVKKNYKEYSIGKLSGNVFWKKIGLPESSEEIFLKEFELSVPISFFKDFKEEYILAIISNLPEEWGFKLLELNELNNLFDYVLISGKEKIAKPQKEVYERLLRLSHMPPSSILFIDDKKSYLKGAKEVGMKTVWIKNDEDDFEFEPDFIINSLEELSQILEKLKGR